VEVLGFKFIKFVYVKFIIFYDALKRYCLCIVENFPRNCS